MKSLEPLIKLMYKEHRLKVENISETNKDIDVHNAYLVS
jgi:hypothetical protein